MSARALYIGIDVQRRNLKLSSTKREVNYFRRRGYLREGFFQGSSPLFKEGRSMLVLNRLVSSTQSMMPYWRLDTTLL